MREFPRLGQPTDIASIRRLTLRPYPYILFHRATDAEILVVGLRHAARDPATMPAPAGNEARTIYHESTSL